MTNVADAELRGPDAGPAAWPSPDGAAPSPALPAPPAADAAPRPVDMPAPLVHQPAVPRGADSAPMIALPTDTPSPGPRATRDTSPEAINTGTINTGTINTGTINTDDIDTGSGPTLGQPGEAEPVPAPALITGPAAILSPTDATSPVDDAAISLPNIAPAPAPPVSKAAPELFMMPESAIGSKPKKSGSRRLGKFLFLAAVVGGLGYAGTMYGPDLYDQYVADDEATEPAAPLAFPRARTTAPDVRTATFVLEGLSTGSETSYTVTVDFETRVSRVAIDRTDAPDLEVLTFSNDALVRRLDSSSWYQIERGAFPFDDQLQKTDWIRMIDDLVPPERRSGVVIDASTESMIAGVMTRHLVLTLDPALLELVNETGDSLDPVGDIADAAASSEADATASDEADATASNEVAENAAPVVDPTTVAVADSAADAGVAGPEQANDQLLSERTSNDRSDPAIETVPVAGEPVGANAIQVELWIDDQGVVRKSMGADVLGANSITLLETIPEAWVPDYPDQQLVQPITAAALLELGL